MLYTCPLCGFPGLTEPPRSPGSGGGSYEICPSYGFEFGFTDDDRGFSYEEWRKRWVQNGMQWQDPSNPPPADWDPVAQLAQLPGQGDSARDKM